MGSDSILGRSRLLALLFVQPLLAFSFVGSATAAVIDFETRADGSSITSTTALPGGEWSSQGVIFRDSFGSAELVEVEAGRSFSVATTFTTSFLSITVSLGTTFVDMSFSTPVTRVDFDFLVRTPSDQITLTAFDSEDVVLTSFSVLASETLTNPRITPEGGGQATVQGVGNISRLRVEGVYSGGVLGIDNLDFAPIPAAVPAVSLPALLVLTAAFAVAGARALQQRT